MISFEKVPSSIYRLQMDSRVSLKKAIQLIPYLFALGIEGVYCSPLFKSHSYGYDVTDPHCLNPALGTEEEFELFCQELQRRGMKQILDVVPNHMGIKENKWWNDVLKYGPDSPFAFFFDIRWNAQGKIILPILSTFYGTALENNDLQLIWDRSFWIQYFEYRLPIAKKSFLQKKIREINENKALLHQLLEEQFYRLSFWKVGEREINYRRFFNINELAAIHMEKKWVFNLHHRWIFELLASEKVAGIRVDHPDGLYDPGLYFERVRNKGASLIWAEKILEPGEELPENWSVDGTVGYDFLNLLCGLFIQKKNEKRMTDIYEKFTQSKPSLKEIKYSRRKNYINNHMTSEIKYLSSLLDKISETNLRWRDLTETDFSQALIEIISCFPVYRTYRRSEEKLRKVDRTVISQAIQEGKKREKDLYAFDFIRDLFLRERLDEPVAEFISRFQQLTAAVMAKGWEDSTFYIYNRLISLNEVGGSPSHFGTTKTEFHRFNRKQRQKFPFSLLPSSTHDTKYSQDARLRIHKLTEFPDLWEQTVQEAARHNAQYKTKIQGALFPDRNTEYFLYQMLIALGRKDKTRLWQCLHKAIREAGIYTSWKKIDAAYEAAVKKF
ncbi:MAG TPA: malto-oligosyltrehalose synthase, partial [Chlamydiales bacterium]|nr:malto-oligosyltrehalose synthase [Chlamydiales bacterium]